MAAVLSIIILSAGFTSSGSFASEEVTSSLLSDVYYMQSLDEETVFFEKKADKKVPVAGFIKLIAAATAIEKWGSLDEKITVSEKNLSLVRYDYGIRTADYVPGEKVTKKELINCLVVYSANDAASIIAYEVSGSLEAFVRDMQGFADKAGCRSTVIKNIHGFDEEGQFTTARDMATLIRYALTFPDFAEAMSAESVTAEKTKHNEERTYKTGNKMINPSIADYYHDSVTAGKYTSTDDAGECAAVISNKDGYSYITITMGGKLRDIDKDGIDENTCFTDAKKMLDWVYENIRYRVIVAPEQTITTVDIIAGKDTDELRLIPEKETSALVPSKVTAASVLFEIVEGSIPEKIKAPVKAGDILGQAKVYYAGRELTTINLIASRDVERSVVGYIVSGISGLVGSKIFLVITVLLFLAMAGHLAYMLCKFFGIIEEKKKQPVRKTTAKTAATKNKKAVKKATPVKNKAQTKPIKKRKD